MKPLYVSLKPLFDYRHPPYPVRWSEVFGNNKSLEVEIGFGNGEYLARMAQERSDVNFLGFEEYCERIHRTLRKLSRVPNDHVRILRMDVRPAFEYLFAPNTISYIHCLYPPPWPKKADIKHRLFMPEFLKLANNRLKMGGVLKIVTDHHPYILWVQEQLPNTGFSAQLKSIAASYDTKFERKWVEGGQKEFYELLLTKNVHMDIVQKKECVVKSYTFKDFNADKFVLPEYSSEGIAVVFRDILFDPSRKTGLIHVLVNDEQICQSIRMVVYKNDGDWNLKLAEGTMMMPTAGIAKALELVYEAILATGKS